METTTKSSPAFQHPLADVQSSAIGPDTRIWQFVVVLAGARIGAGCNICSHCFIENDVEIGDRVTIKCGVQVWDGLRIEDDVFVGPNVSFTNDTFPRSRQHKPAALTRVRRGASIGAGATILPGIEIGTDAMVGAGAVVVRSVPPNAIVVGNPARIVGYSQTPRSTHAPSKVSPPSLPGTSVRGVSLHELPRFGDIRGDLVVGEVERLVPFVPRRFFTVFNVSSAQTRGEHAHRKCHQFLLCVHGSCSLVVDDGRNRQEFVLDRPTLGVHLEPMVWGIQYRYTSDAVLLVFASDPYDAADYIRNYDEFRQLTKAP